jgi:hypothetical protein
MPAVLPIIATRCGDCYPITEGPIESAGLSLTVDGSFDRCQPYRSGRERASAMPATAGKRCGWITLGLLGHLTITTAGVSFASISSTVIVLVAVILFEASSLTLVTGFLLLASWISGPLGGANYWRAHLHLGPC